MLSNIAIGKVNVDDYVVLPTLVLSLVVIEVSFKPF